MTLAELTPPRPYATDAAERRPLPGNPAAEQALLAGLLANNEAIIEVEDLLRPEHFSVPLLGRLYSACATLFARSHLANAITLARSFAEDPELDAAGGVAYLEELQESWVKLSDLRGYAEAIRDTFLRRQLVEIAERTAREALSPAPEQSAETQLEQLEEQIFRLGESGETHAQLQHIRTGFQRAIDWTDRARKGDATARPLSSGLKRLDEILGGFYRSDLVILAARPSMGKTALATNIALSVARANGDQPPQTVAFFSLEMAHEQLAARLLAETSNVKTTEMRRGEVSAEQLSALYKAYTELEGIPLYIDDSAGLTVGAIRARARRLKRTAKGLGLIIVDYLQLISPGRASENRVQEISEITRGLKALAKELDAPVLALSQLSRAVEQRENKRPNLSDLRESGSIEQDADVVLFIFREIYYKEQEEPRRRESDSEEKFEKRRESWQEHCEKIHNNAEISIAKHRHGPTGVCRLFFDKTTTRFSDVESGADMPFPPFGEIPDAAFDEARDAAPAHGTADATQSENDDPNRGADTDGPEEPPL